MYRIVRGLRGAVLVLIAIIAPVWARAAFGQAHPLPPALSSRPDAFYTLYLDFSGFAFNGYWGNGDFYPGAIGAYNAESGGFDFTPTEVANIHAMWSRVAEKYSPFNINVTTVDPAVAAGQVADDTMRQNFYDAQPFLMHTIIGTRLGAGTPGGISYLGVADEIQTGSNGKHTNFVFSTFRPTEIKDIGEAIAHENGHALGLYHQSDYVGNTLVREYSVGPGDGLIAPFMGSSDSSERGMWIIGTGSPANGPVIQNDARVVALTPYMNGFIDDGVGHSLATATPLPLDGSLIDFQSARGVIVPNDSVNPFPTGVENYVADFWSFSTAAATLQIELRSGISTIDARVADDGAMLDATLLVLDSLGNPMATSANGTLLESLTLSLASGDYYIKVQSAGDPRRLGYFDMGSYFLTGSVIAVPEPSTLALAALGVLGALAWRRRGNALPPASP